MTRKAEPPQLQDPRCERGSTAFRGRTAIDRSPGEERRGSALLIRAETWLPAAVLAMLAVLLVLFLAALYGPELYAAVQSHLEFL